MAVACGARDSQSAGTRAIPTDPANQLAPQSITQAYRARAVQSRYAHGYVHQCTIAYGPNSNRKQRFQDQLTMHATRGQMQTNPNPAIRSVRADPC